jgi:hypothetical protein
MAHRVEYHAGAEDRLSISNLQRVDFRHASRLGFLQRGIGK